MMVGMVGFEPTVVRAWSVVPHNAPRLTTVSF